MMPVAVFIFVLINVSHKSGGTMRAEDERTKRIFDFIKIGVPCSSSSSVVLRLTNEATTNAFATTRARIIQSNGMIHG